MSAGRRGAVLVVVAGLLGTAGASPVRAEGEDARQRWWRDGDAVALAAALGSSSDPLDRDDAALARRAARQTPIVDPGGAPLLAVVVDAFGRSDLAAAQAAVGDAPAETAPAEGPRQGLLRALLDARRGRDDDALRRLVEGPVPTPGRDGPGLALLGTALAVDDRDLLVGLLRAACVRAGTAGRADVVGALGEAAAAVDPASASLALVPAARILRRAGRPADALALLDGPAARRAGRDMPALRLERATLAWRRNDAATARSEAAGAAGGDIPWLAAALSRAGACCALVPAPALVPPPAGEDPDAAALARLVTTLGTSTRAEEVVTRAAARSTSPADPAFVAAFIDSVDLVGVETAGDPAVLALALGKGLPVLLWRIRREGERFADRPVLVRGHDPTTGLLVVDEPDPSRPDVLPLALAEKARALVAAPRARAAELAAWKGTVAARRGAYVASGLSALAVSGADAAAARFAARPAELAGDAVGDLYQGFAVYAPAFAARDAARLAESGTILRRSGAAGPWTGLERLLRAEAMLGGDPDPALAELDAAARDEGAATWIEVTKFVILERARRHADALEALRRARVLEPLDVRTLYFRAGTRRLLGDGPGARADLVRVLERRPDHVPATEDLAGAYVEDGDPERALAVVRRLATVDPQAAATRRVRQLRQRVELRLVRRARAAEDLLPLATSPEPEVRAEVAWTASSFESDAAETLLRGLLVDPDDAVRRRAATAWLRPSMGDRAARDPRLVELLAGRLAADPSPGVREALARVLGRIRAAAAVAALLGRLGGAAADPAAGVRAAIAEALADAEGPAARAGLVDALEDGESVVRTAAIRSLRRAAGTSYGFEPDDPPDRRAAAVAEWRRRSAAPR